MKLDYPFLQLPVAFDATALAREVDALGEEAWRPHPQGYPGNSALPLVSVEGDPTSDAVRGPMRPTPLLLACPYLMQVMGSIGAVWGRSRLMRLSGQAEVSPHVDINYYWREHMRVHVPIVTQPTVRFMCGGASINMAPGECWIFDTWRLHRVHNDDQRARIHLVADTVGGAGFWQLMRQCRPHDRAPAGWQPALVAPGAPGAAPEFESVNLPQVMSPWELRDHLSFLVGEARETADLRGFAQGLVGPFVRDWRALWAKHGDSGAGQEEFAALRDAFVSQLPRFQSIRLENGVVLVNAVRMIVSSNLLAQGGTGSGAELRDSTTSAGQVAAPAVDVRSTTDQVGTPTIRAAGAGTAGPRPQAPMPSPQQAQSPRFDRPIVILSAPRSGSTLLFETLGRAPSLFTIGGESHRAIEGLPGLHPSQRGWESNRLLGPDATPQVAAAVRASLGALLRDRDGKPPAGAAPVRLLEKTPKNILRVPFLRQVFPDAQLVFLYREPRDVLASMIEAWRSGRFRTYPDLPGWTGPTWSMLLVPGWRELDGQPMEVLVARQWSTAVETLLDDLEALPAGSVTAIRYARLLEHPQREIQRLCSDLGLGWDVELDSLPRSRTTLTAPDPDKWRVHEAALANVLPGLEPTRRRAEAFLARLGQDG